MDDEGKLSRGIDMEFSWKALVSFFEENRKMEKLSDKITWEPECVKLVDELAVKMKQDLYEAAKKACYEQDRAKIDESILWNVLHNYRKRYMDFAEQPPP